MKYARIIGKIKKEIAPIIEADSKSVLRQWYEIARVALTAQYTPSEYYMYNTHKKNKTLNDLVRYISNSLWIDKLWPALTDKRWEHVLQNKWLFQLYYREYGLPVPKAYGFYTREGGMMYDGTIIRNFADLSNYLFNLQPETLVLKPIYGGQGKLVVVFKSLIYENNEIAGISISGKKYRLADITKSIMRYYRRYSGILLEEKIDQHESLENINPFTINTLRVQTLLKKNGEPVIIGGIIRCGRKGSDVDNLSQGGFSRGIDIENGQICEGGILSDKNRNISIKVHPDIQTPLNRVKIPMWNEIIDTINKFTVKTMFARLVGWDVIVTKSGPVVIEGNPDMGLDITQSHTEGFLTDQLIADFNEFGINVNLSKFNKINLRSLRTAFRRWF
jgi:hypothetical protein